MANEDLAHNVASVFLESGLSGLCGGAAEPTTTATDIVEALPYQGDWCCEATLGLLRAEGVDVVMVDTPPKCVILLNLDDLGADWYRKPFALVNWEGWDHLRSLFSDPRRV